MSRILSVLACLIIGTNLATAQQPPVWTAQNPPKFDDYPVGEIWHGTPAPVKLATRSERLFRTNLTNAAKEPPDFAGHYRLTIWGCGSNCAAGALIDLLTGEVSQPPGAPPDASGWDRWIIHAGMMEGAAIEHRASSRLMIIRGGLNYSERLDRNVPDERFYVWGKGKFRLVLTIAGGP